MGVTNGPGRHLNQLRYQEHQRIAKWGGVTTKVHESCGDFARGRLFYGFA